MDYMLAGHLQQHPNVSIGKAVEHVAPLPSPRNDPGRPAATATASPVGELGAQNRDA